MGIASKLAQTSSAPYKTGDPVLDATRAQAQPGYPAYNNGIPVSNAHTQSPNYVPQHGVVPVQSTGASVPVYQDAAQVQYLNNAGYAVQPLPSLISLDQQAIHHKLTQLVRENELSPFYSPQAVAELAARIAQRDLRALAQDWRLSNQMVLDLAALSLYDTVVLCDDSASMRIDEGGERIKDLKAILERVASVCGLLDTDGITLLSLNSDWKRENVTTAKEAADFVDLMRFEGMTPLGTMIQKKVVEPYVARPARTGMLRKPVHVIVLTDGEPNGEPPKEVKSVINTIVSGFRGSRFGPGAVVFQFAQVGTDKAAQAFLATLDASKKVGDKVDCTSSYEIEQEEFLQKTGINLTPDMYLNKLCLGAIDRSYDAQDEAKRKKGFFKRVLK